MNSIFYFKSLLLLFHKGDEGMPLDMILINFEKLGAVLGILAYTILLGSAQQAEKELVREQITPKSPIVTPTSSQLSVNAVTLSLITGLILSTVALIRLKERERNIALGTDTNPITPNINVTLGSWIGILGTSSVLLGALQRETQSRRGLTII